MAIERMLFPEGIAFGNEPEMRARAREILNSKDKESQSETLVPGIHDITPERFREGYFTFNLLVDPEGKAVLSVTLGEDQKVEIKTVKIPGDSDVWITCDRVLGEENGKIIELFTYVPSRKKEKVSSSLKRFKRPFK